MSTPHLTDAMVEAGARTVLMRMARRRDSALQQVSNAEALPIPKALLDDVRAAFEAAFAAAAVEANPEGPQG